MTIIGRGSVPLRQGQDLSDAALNLLDQVARYRVKYTHLDEPGLAELLAEGLLRARANIIRGTKLARVSLTGKGRRFYQRLTTVAVH